MGRLNGKNLKENQRRIKVMAALFAEGDHDGASNSKAGRNRCRFEDYVPVNHLLRLIDRFLDLRDLCGYLPEHSGFSKNRHSRIDVIVA
jgi:hypothetical protein